MASAPGERAAIVIFGAAVRPDGRPSGTLRARVEAAARFGEGLAIPPLYLPTGARGRFGAAESSVMAALLQESFGVPPGRILEEPTGTDTLTSARAVAGLLRGHAGPVLVATSAYHLPRCMVLLHLAGFPAGAVPPPGMPAASAWRKRWWWRLREVPALPYDGALMLWHRARGAAAEATAPPVPPSPLDRSAADL
jgi:uncharacterized SAM-binding protein YcdF (DUF218 family)